MRRIIVIEDNKSDLKLISHLIRNSGFQVVEVSDPLKGLELLNEFEFDLIFLDWMMPVVTGIEILKQIRRGGLNGKSPVIFITGRSDTKDIQRAISEGITDYIIKPIDRMVLENKLERTLLGKNDWTTYSIPDNKAISSKILMETNIVGLSEVGIIFETKHPVQIGENLNLNLDFVGQQSFCSAVRVQNCEAEKHKYKIHGVFVGLKESEMRTIRVFLKEIAIVKTNRHFSAVS